MSEEMFDVNIQHGESLRSTTIATVSADTIGTPERFSVWLSGLLENITPVMRVRDASTGGRELLEKVRSKPYSVICAHLRCTVSYDDKPVRLDDYYITLEEKEN